jgi:DNA-binding NtrC family response regulator
MKILLVDDDALVIRLIKTALGDSYRTLTAGRSSEALRLIAEGPELAIVDLDLEQRLEGLSLIGPLKKAGIKTVVMSSHEEEELIERCYEAGCDLYYSKGRILDSIHQIINDLLVRDLVTLEDELFQNSFVTVNEKLKADIKRAFRSFMQASNILITGETGTGKSELAKLFYQQSGLQGEFVAINCASIPRELLESELFGHTRGAFTGADKAKTGKLKLADNGVLFLDEINSLGIDLQAKLLKAVEEKKFYPVGSERMVETNFRLISASNENLFELVAQNRFRLDLLQRLCGTMIELTPLRDRSDDVFPLLKHFNHSQRKLFFSGEAKTMIALHDWPGNTREVKRLLEFCLSLPGGRIEATDFQKFMNFGPTEVRNRTLDLEYWLQQALSKGLETATDDFRKRIIEEAMRSRGLNVTATMRELKISTRQFYKHIGGSKGQMSAFAAPGIEYAAELQ